jgi:hypothetical protein
MGETEKTPVNLRIIGAQYIDHLLGKIRILIEELPENTDIDLPDI